MFLEPVDELQITEIVNKFKPKMSSGHCEIPTKIMKHSILCIIQPLIYVIKKPFETEVVPSKLKIAKVILFFKSSKKGRIEKLSAFYQPFLKLLRRLSSTQLWHL